VAKAVTSARLAAGEGEKTDKGAAMPTLTFEHSGVRADADEGEWLYDVCERAGAGIPFACKAGACGTCATPVLAGIEHLAKVTAREARTLTNLRLDLNSVRLPCLKDVGGGDVVWGRPVNVAECAADLQSHTVVVESYRPLNLSVAEVRFYVGTEGFAYRPGQYMIFPVPNLPHPIRRSYSIATPPSDANHFEVCVRAVAGGAGSNFIHRLRPGQTLNVEGPFGDFVLDEDSSRDILMIATGTGMAPIKSMLMHLLERRSSRRVRLFFGLRHESDLFHTDLLRGLKAHYPGFEYRIILSRADPEIWSGPRGRVTDLIDKYVTGDDAARSEAYICGGRPMIDSCVGRLKDLGFPEDAIKYERFF
jgi:ferredoxin-NADP reductase/ferredoxin